MYTVASIQCIPLKGIHVYCWKYDAPCEGWTIDRQWKVKTITKIESTNIRTSACKQHTTYYFQYLIRIPLVSIIISIRFGMDSYYIIKNFYGKINHTQFHTWRKLFKRFFSDVFFQHLGFQFVIDQMKQIFYRVEVRTPCWDTEALHSQML